MLLKAAILAVEREEAKSCKALGCIQYNNDMLVKDMFFLSSLTSFPNFDHVKRI